LKSAGTLDPSGEKFDVQANYIASSDTQPGLTSVLTATAHESRHPYPCLDESLKFVAEPGWSGEMSDLQPVNITSSITQSVFCTDRYITRESSFRSFMG